MNAGIKRFQAKGKAGVTNKLTHLHGLSAFCPIKQDTLTYNKKKKALLLLMFLKEKRDSSVKVHLCTNEHKQKDGMWSKQETTLPAVATELVFITAVINTNKGDIGHYIW